MSFIKKIFGSKEEKKSPTDKQPATPPPPEPQPIQINEVSPHELKTRLDNGDKLIVVDMRQGWEYQSGHIPGAKNIFLQEIPARIGELPKDIDIVFQCWSGLTSLDASGFLIQNGWDSTRVFSLRGGIGGWTTTFGPAGLVKD